MTKQLFISNDKNPVFTCAHCFEYYSHTWIYAHGPFGEDIRSAHVPIPKGSHPFDDRLLGIIKSTCNECNKATFWMKSKKMDEPELQVYPSNFVNYPQPHKDMPDHIKKTYIEAGSVLSLSLGSSAALSRLAFENLLIHLGYQQKTLNDKIQALVAEGGIKNRKMLDVIRVFGNSGAHSGIINLDETPEVPMFLLKLINFIVEETITIPKNVDALYDLLPAGIKAGIEKRDS